MDSAAKCQDGPKNNQCDTTAELLNIFHVRFHIWFFCLLGKQSEEQSIAFVFLTVSAKETLVFFMNLVVVVVRDLYSY
jgi:hypothetical protein